MRVLCTTDDHECVLIEVNEIFYDNDILNIADEDGSYDIYNDHLTEGLMFYDYESECFYIPNLNESKVNTILIEVLSKGYIDLRTFGKVVSLDDKK